MNPIDALIRNQQVIIELLEKIIKKQDHFSNLAEIIEAESTKEDN